MNYNVRKLQMVIGFAIALMNDLRLKLEDGKLTVIEMLSLLPFLKDLWQIISDIHGIKKAYLGLKPDEKKELIDYFRNEFDLPNDRTEKMIESFFETLIGLSGFFAQIFNSVEPAKKLESETKEV